MVALAPAAPAQFTTAELPLKPRRYMPFADVKVLLLASPACSDSMYDERSGGWCMVVGNCRTWYAVLASPACASARPLAGVISSDAFN